MVSADFDDTMTMADGERLIAAMEDELKAAMPALASVYIRPRDATQTKWTSTSVI